jgi:hypothetical protein
MAYICMLSAQTYQARAPEKCVDRLFLSATAKLN